jgi:hypothetical protein
MLFQKALRTLGPAKNSGGDLMLVEPVQDMAAHEPTGSCEQNFQSE